MSVSECPTIQNENDRPVALSRSGKPIRPNQFQPGNTFGRANRENAKRKRTFELIREAKALAPLALDTIKAIMIHKSINPATRLAAAKELLDRGYGKPKENVQIDKDIRVTHAQRLDITGMSEEQLDALELALRQTLMSQQRMIEAQPNHVEIEVARDSQSVAPSPNDQ